MKPVHTDFRPVAKDGYCGITGPGENRFQHLIFRCLERPQYVIDNVTPASRTPDADTQTGKFPAAQGIHD